MFLKNFDPVVSDEVFSVGTAHDVITPPIGFKIFSPEKSPKVSLSIKYKLLSANPELSVVVTQYPSTVLNKHFTVHPKGPFT